MSNFNFGEWEAYLEYRPEMLGWCLYLSKHVTDGRQFLTERGTLSVVKHGEQFKKTDKVYFAYFEDEQQLQAIANAISKRGIKDQNDHRNEGLLEATKYHLEDMRRIALRVKTKRS